MAARIRDRLAAFLVGSLGALAIGALALPSASASANGAAGQVTYYNANYGGRFYRSPSPTTIESDVYGISQSISGNSIELGAGPYPQYTDSGFSIYRGTLASLQGLMVQGSGSYGLNLWLDTNKDGDFFSWDSTVSGSVYMTGLGGDLYLLGDSTPNAGGVLVVSGSTPFNLQGGAGGTYTLSQLQQGALTGVTGSTQVAVWIGIVGSTTGSQAAAEIDQVQFGPPSTVGVTTACKSAADGTAVSVNSQSFHCGYDAFPTIQAAVDAVAPNGTVEVAAGTYQEQIKISQPMTLTGAGQGNTFIDLPVAPATTASVRTKSPLVYGIDVNGTTGVTISNVTLDGQSATNGVDGCGDGFAGVTFQDASGTVQDTTLTGWTPESGAGCGSGKGIQVETDSAGTAAVNVENSTVTGYGKAGIYAAGQGAALTATGDTVTGAPTSQVAANGIEVVYGAAGTLSGNTVTGNQYTGTVSATDPQADYAAGVLLYDAGGAPSVSGNTLTDDQVGIETVATSATLNGNTISQTGAGIANGIGIYSVPCDEYCGAGTPSADEVTIQQNQLSGIPWSYGNYSNPAVASAGIWLGNTTAAGATGSIQATVKGNSVTGGYFGIVVGPNSAGANASISGNQVSGFERDGIDAGSFELGGGGVTGNISGNTVTGAGSGNTDPWAQNGIEIANGAQGSVDGNHVTGMVYTGTKPTTATGILVFESSGVTVVRNALLDDQLGIAVESGGYSADSANWTMSNDQVRDNTIGFDASYQAPGQLPGENAGTWGIWAGSYNAAASVDTVISGNVLKGSGADAGSVPSVGIQVGDTAAQGAAGSLSAQVSGNTVTGFDYGVEEVGTTTGSGVTFSSAVNYNDLGGNATAGLENLTGSESGMIGAPSLDATNNWWGSASGPQSASNTYDVATQGDVASGSVSFTPWLTSAPAPDAGSGANFAPVFDRMTGGYFASIQAALNAAGAGDQITVAAGTFSEALTITKPVTLDGAQFAADARSRSGPESIIDAGAAADVTIHSDGVTLDGFTLHGPVSQGTAAIVMMGGNTNETIENNIILDLGRAVSYNTSDTTFQQNVVDETAATAADGIQENSGAVSGVHIVNNTFAGDQNNNDITFIGTSATHNQGIEITGNVSTDPGTFAALFHTDDAILSGNSVSGAAGSAIYIGGADNGIAVNHNTLVATSSSPAYAVVVSNQFGDGPSSDVHVNLNSLYGLGVATGAYTGGNGTVEATDDWWGSASGPSGVTEGAVAATPYIESLAISPPMLRSEVGSPLQWTASIVDETGTAITDSNFSATFAVSGTATCQNPAPTTAQAFGGPVGFGCTPKTTGGLTVTGDVALNGVPLTLSGTASVDVVPPPANPPGGGGGSGSGPNGNDSSTVTVNGGVTTFTVNSGMLTQNLSGLEGSDVTFSSNTTGTDISLSADALQSLDQGNDGITLETPGATYTLPSGSIDVTQLETLLGVTQPSDISLSISVTPASNADTSDITQGLQGGTIVGAPMTFTITATANGQAQTIEVFSGPVPRTFTLDSPPDPTDTTGVVLVNGVPEHAWTVFSGTTATIYSRTDSTYAVVTHEVSFDDIAGLPQENAIQALANKLIVNGMTQTTFDPQGGVTRAQFAALVIRALGLWNLGGTVTFPDVQSDSWAAPVIRSAVAESFIEGYPDGTFQPQAQITNAQMAVIVGRVMRFLGIAAGQTAVTPSDETAIPAWAANDVQLVLSQGIMTTGSDGAFHPGATTNRAQAAQIIWNLMQKAGIQ